jgi:hypothetical protein
VSKRVKRSESRSEEASTNKSMHGSDMKSLGGGSTGWNASGKCEDEKDELIALWVEVFASGGSTGWRASNVCWEMTGNAERLGEKGTTIEETQKMLLHQSLINSAPFSSNFLQEYEQNPLLLP